MKLLTLLTPALLAATVYAVEGETATGSSASTATSSASSAEPPKSSGDPKASAPVDEPTPVGELWTAKWDADTLKPYSQHCNARNTYNAEIYQLAELYPTLKEYAPQLKVFYNKQHYPGSWKGEDKHGGQRDLMKMDMAELPYKVREWLRRETKQKHFSVHEDVVFFAPGAIYPILPLWVDEPTENVGECEGVFDDLENYSNDPKDGFVIGKVAHSNQGKNKVEFTVEALQVKAQEQSRDEL